MTNWDALSERLGLELQDSYLLRQAVTHSSAVPESPGESNERLEFLGDAILGFTLAEALHTRYPDRREGILAQMKSYVVSEDALADAALTWGLDSFLRLGSGEAMNGGARRKSILSDAFEAMLAAIYLEYGIDQAKRIALVALEGAIKSVETDTFRYDHKSALQKITQAQGFGAPTYQVVSIEGPDHDRVFTARATLGDRSIGEGSGSSKKSAEQAAAMVAMQAHQADLLLSEIPE